MFRVLPYYCICFGTCIVNNTVNYCLKTSILFFLYLNNCFSFSSFTCIIFLYLFIYFNYMEYFTPWKYKLNENTDSRCFKTTFHYFFIQFAVWKIPKRYHHWPAHVTKQKETRKLVTCLDNRRNLSIQRKPWLECYFSSDYGLHCFSMSTYLCFKKKMSQGGENKGILVIRF
jgi:hypothetical protein